MKSVERTVPSKSDWGLGKILHSQIPSRGSSSTAAAPHPATAVAPRQRCGALSCSPAHLPTVSFGQAVWAGLVKRSSRRWRQYRRKGAHGDDSHSLITTHSGGARERGEQEGTLVGAQIAFFALHTRKVLLLLLYANLGPENGGRCCR